MTWLTVAGIAVLTALFAAAPLDALPAQTALSIVLLLAALTAISIKPVVGLYVMVSCSLVPDVVTLAWFPFLRNFSNRESTLFLAEQLAISPMEVVLGVTVLSWAIRQLGTRRAAFVTGPMFMPVAAFAIFVVFGFVNGIASGGNIRIAVMEGRSLLYLPLLYVLMVNLCGRAHLRRLVWTAALAITANAAIALWYLTQKLTAAQLLEREDLGQHSASVHYGTVIVLFVALCLYGKRCRSTALGLAVLCVPVVLALFSAQRRGAFIGIGFALAWVVASLWWRHRARFWKAAPVLATALTLYTAAFWNSTSGAAIGAQAIKSVLAPDDVTSKDQSSDEYRIIENLNLNYTIRQAPVLGIGFGVPFYRPYPLPSINAFELALYQPHNSVLWIWIKTGFLGFVSMFWMFGLAVRQGVHRLFVERSPIDAAAVVTALGYVGAYAIFTFIDFSWDPASVVFLALAFAICGGATRPSPASRSGRVARPAVPRDDQLVLSRQPLAASGMRGNESG